MLTPLIAALLAAERRVRCFVRIRNSGNVGLQNVSLSGDAVCYGWSNGSATGPVQSIGYLPPGSEVGCDLVKAVTDAQLQGGGALVLSHPVSSVPALENAPVTSTTLQLSQLIAASSGCESCQVRLPCQPSLCCFGLGA